AHHVGLVAPWDRDEDRAEDLFPREAPIVPDVGEHRRLYVVTLREWAVAGRWPADDRARVLLARALLDVAHDLFELLPAHDGAHIARFIEGVADLHLRELPGELVHERVEHGLAHEQARARRARLPLPREAHRGDHALGGALVVGIGEEDLRALAAELERHGDDAVGGEPKDRLTGLGGAGDRDLHHERMLGERSPDLFARSGHDVEHALRQMPLADPREREDRERSVRGWLEHHGVAGEQRGRDLPRRNEDGDVPGNNRGYDTERFTSRVREHRFAERDRLALDLTAQSAEVPEKV